MLVWPPARRAAHFNCVDQCPLYVNVFDNMNEWSIRTHNNQNVAVFQSRSACGEECMRLNGRAAKWLRCEMVAWREEAANIAVTAWYGSSAPQSQTGPTQIVLQSATICSLGWWLSVESRRIICCDPNNNNSSFSSNTIYHNLASTSTKKRTENVEILRTYTRTVSRSNHSYPSGNLKDFLHFLLANSCCQSQTMPGSASWMKFIVWSDNRNLKAENVKKCFRFPLG